VCLSKPKLFLLRYEKASRCKNAPLFKTESHPSVHFSKPKLALLKYEKAHRCTLFEPKIALFKHDKGSLLKPTITVLKQVKAVFVRTLPLLKPKSVFFTKVGVSSNRKLDLSKVRLSKRKFVKPIF
jgi:hypothetical protein